LQKQIRIIFVIMGCFFGNFAVMVCLLLLLLFPMSLCGVLVFRLDPATSPPPSLSAASFRRVAFTTHHSPTSHTSLIIAQLIIINHLTYHNSSQLHFSHLTYHIYTSQRRLYNSSQPDFSLIAAQLININHLTYHNSSQLRGQQTAFRLAGALHSLRYVNLVESDPVPARVHIGTILD
jgi:hypothetical protein